MASYRDQSVGRHARSPARRALIGKEEATAQFWMIHARLCYVTVDSSSPSVGVAPPSVSHAGLICLRYGLGTFLYAPTTSDVGHKRVRHCPASLTWALYDMQGAPSCIPGAHARLQVEQQAVPDVRSPEPSSRLHSSTTGASCDTSDGLADRHSHELWRTSRWQKSL